jgi:hypothetical protein
VIDNFGIEFRICSCGELISKEDGTWIDENNFTGTEEPDHVHAPDENWTGHKFEDEDTQILWLWSLEGSQDEEFGDSEYANYFLFKDIRRIMWETLTGFVYSLRFDNDSEMMAEWAEQEAEWLSFDNARVSYF